MKYYEIKLVHDILTCAIPFRFLRKLYFLYQIFRNREIVHSFYSAVLQYRIKNWIKIVKSRQKEREKNQTELNMRRQFKLRLRRC